ncbi:acetolactate synthase large subunit [Ramlibacter sp.]|uniref:acetolactate synthase large subunit n=1 Tax=Ramlibacter sp. TaxID=1917967 RepID=UPI003D0DDC47
MTSSAATPSFGADVVVASLVAHGVDTFFANPGTSEIHLVSAIDRHPTARAVLCLFEGVATGAADGYARASGKPAAVLLHLGPGLANGLANLHNAMKAGTPMIVLVGEHATQHLQYESPLRSDLESLAGYAAKEVMHARPGDDLDALIARAVAATQARPSGPVVVVANADVMWGAPGVAGASGVSDAGGASHESSAPGTSNTSSPADRPPPLDAAKALAFLRSPGATVLLGGAALSAHALKLADSLAQLTGCTLMCETFNALHERGAGVPHVERLPYFRELAVDKLASTRHLLLLGSRPPVSFFGSPDAGSVLTAPDAQVLAHAPTQSPVALLEQMAQLAGTLPAPRVVARTQSDAPAGALSPKAVWAAVNRALPEGAVVSDESGVSSVGADDTMKGAAPHSWMNLTGGSIGQGLPAGTGAAIATPGRQTLVFHGDGGAMYTVQSLWTQAREKAKVVNVIFRNDRYAILDHEVKRHGLPPLGPKGAAMFSLAEPTLDWVSVARGMGVPAVTVRTAEEFVEALGKGLGSEGPCLIEAVMGAPKKKT